MILVEQVSAIAVKLRDAAIADSLVRFYELNPIFDSKPEANDLWDTLDAASRALAYLPIYSSLMAKTEDDLPGNGFYHYYHRWRREEYDELAKGVDIRELDQDQRRRIAKRERERVYKHAQEKYESLLADS